MIHNEITYTLRYCPDFDTFMLEREDMIVIYTDEHIETLYTEISFDDTRTFLAHSERINKLMQESWIDEYIEQRNKS